jgi:hypothetical protein
MVRLLLTNWLVVLLEAGLIWGEPRAAPECSRANRVFVEYRQEVIDLGVPLVERPPYILQRRQCIYKLCIKYCIQ